MIIVSYKKNTDVCIRDLVPGKGFKYGYSNYILLEPCSTLKDAIKNTPIDYNCFVLNVTENIIGLIPYDAIIEPVELTIKTN